MGEMFWVTRGVTPRQFHEVLAFGLLCTRKGRRLTTLFRLQRRGVGTGHTLEDAPGTIDV
jgi:hypothetical protein